MGGGGGRIKKFGKKGHISSTHGELKENLGPFQTPYFT